MRDEDRVETPASRRGVLALGVGAALAAATSARAQTPPPPDPLAPGQSFDAAKVVDLARTLAKQAYQAPRTDLPDGLKDLTYEQYVGIRARPGALLWSGEGRGFAV